MVVRVLVLLIGWFSSMTFVTCESNKALFSLQKSIADVVSRVVFKDKCMGELGCFNNGPPFFDVKGRLVSLAPWDRSKINTYFHLYNRFNPREPQNFTNQRRSPQDLFESNFLSAAPIKFIVPGFGSSSATAWETTLKDALLSKGDFNVFFVDWSGGSGPLYEQAVANARVVGAEIAVFIEFLKTSTNVRPENIHIIGHSLGAHVAGYAGKRIKRIGRITGLDPAGPDFENVSPEVRLAPTDAILVDVIHTNGANSVFAGFGTTESIGDLDFFPNGGRLQPGCPDLGAAIWDILKRPLFNADGLAEIACNHERAVELFISSITESSCKMMAIQCRSWEDFVDNGCGSCSEDPSRCAIMGYEADKSWQLPWSPRSNLYLNTTDSHPFCKPMLLPTFQL